MARNFPDWLTAYLSYTAHNEAPEKFHFWAGVSCIAAALRRRIWLDQGYFQWTPNFYIIFVSPPGIITKSTTISIGSKLLREVPEVLFGPQSITWQALVESLARSQTLTELSPGVYTPMSAVTFSISELGTFLDPSNREMLDLLTELWDGQGGVFDKVTKTSGSESVENPWVNLIGCTTPAWLRRNVSEDVMGGGLSSRIIWLWGEKKRRLVAYPGLHLPKSFAADSKKLSDDLKKISDLRGPVSLSSSATAYGETWYNKHYARMASEQDPTLLGYLSRKQTHLHKLAMVLSVSSGDSLVVDEVHLQKADALLTAVEAELHHVFNCIRETPESQLSHRILSHVNAAPMTVQELYSAFFGTVGHKDFTAALENCVKAGRLELFSGPPGVFNVRKPSGSHPSPGGKSSLGSPPTPPLGGVAGMLSGSGSGSGS